MLPTVALAWSYRTSVVAQGCCSSLKKLIKSQDVVPIRTDTVRLKLQRQQAEKEQRETERERERDKTRGAAAEGQT
jgi:hypothetical protein